MANTKKPGKRVKPKKISLGLSMDDPDFDRKFGILEEEFEELRMQRIYENSLKKARGGVATKKKMRGGGMLKTAAKKKMARGGVAKKKMARGGVAKKKMMRGGMAAKKRGR